MPFLTGSDVLGLNLALDVARLACPLIDALQEQNNQSVNRRHIAFRSPFGERPGRDPASKHRRLNYCEHTMAQRFAASGHKKRRMARSGEERMCCKVRVGEDGEFN